MMGWLVGTITVLVILGFGARWLFRQRDPEEIRAARERINALRRKPPSD
jgi:hypothetical protein